jgi:serine phosphatase RsbU (regulator of sigma subunit)
VLGDCYAENAIALSPAFGEIRGREAIVASWARLFVSKKVDVDLATILVDGDRVAVLGAITSPDLHEWFGRPAVDTPISYRIVLLFTLADGKVVHDRRLYDSAGVVERLEKARVDKELRTAADVQRALLSRTPRAGAFYTAVGDSIPCRAIGGDFCEFIDLPSGDLGILIGDVAGKGPAAALLAAMLQGMFAADPEARSPSAVLERINRRLLARDLGAKYATLVYAVLLASGRLIYCNAGHNPPVLLTAGGAERLTIGGPILGGFADATFTDGCLQLDAGDTLVMFTDGVTEARNAAGDEFGEDGLLARVAAGLGLEPAAVVERVLAGVRDFCATTEQYDDVTVAVTRFG